MFWPMTPVVLHALIAARRRQQRAAIEYDRAVRALQSQTVIV